MIVYVARHVLPVVSPPVAGGAVAVADGRVIAVGRRKDVTKVAGSAAEVRDLGDACLLPGLVNAHTHVELSFMGGAGARGLGYVEWLRDLLERRDREDQAAAVASAESAVAEMSRRGTAAVGDVGNREWAAAVLGRSAMRGVAFFEIYGFRPADAERLLDGAAAGLDRIESDADVRAARDRVRVFLTPHGIHTTSDALLKALAGRAVATGEPMSIHLAETEDEVGLIRDGSGPLVALLEERGMWDNGWKPTGHSPVEHLDRLGALSPRTLAVHCVHVGREDLSRLQARGVTVVTCPRSNEALGVGTAPVPKILGAGIPVALGTDSLASAPDLDLFAEMAALRRVHPGLAPAAVLRTATLNGARALGLADRLGSIETGKEASLAVVPLADPGDEPLETVTSGPAEAASVDAAPWETTAA